MMFLIRVAFWLSIVILLLPTGQTQQASGGPQIGTAEAFSAAGAAVSDMRAFCSRQPDACTVGSQAATAFGHKAQASVKLVYDFFTEKLGSDPAPAAATGKPAASGNVEVAARAAQNTLAPADRAPPWRGPRVHSELAAKPGT